MTGAVKWTPQGYRYAVLENVVHVAWRPGYRRAPVVRPDDVTRRQRLTCAIAGHAPVAHDGNGEPFCPRCGANLG